MLILPGSFIAGLLTYLILSYLYTPIRISIPLSILISTLIFSLNKYYFLPESNMKDKRRLRQHNAKGYSYTYGSRNLVFIWAYGILISILIATSVSEQNYYRSSYVSWEK